MSDLTIGSRADVSAFGGAAPLTWALGHSGKRLVVVVLCRRRPSAHLVARAVYEVGASSGAEAVGRCRGSGSLHIERSGKSLAWRIARPVVSTGRQRHPYRTEQGAHHGYQQSAIVAQPGIQADQPEKPGCRLNLGVRP